AGSSVPNQLRRLLELLRKADEARSIFILNGNPWAEPPEAVMNSGIGAVIRYFDALYSSPCRVRRNIVKVVLVGQEGAGKTSLCRSMKTGRATPTDGSTESTVYADVERMNLNGTSVRVYDCAGQVAYTGLLQMFLTPRAVCLVVCNAGAFGQQGGGADDDIENDIRHLHKLRVCDWLRSISYRVPSSDVILVATKCDLVGGNAAGIAQRMGAACQKWLERWVGAGMAAVRLEDGVCRTSCFVKATPTNTFQAVGALFEELPSLLFGPEKATPGNRFGGLHWECDWRDDVATEPSTRMLDRVINKRDGRGLRGAEMVLPHSWDIALTVLEALENGRHPVDDVMKTSGKPIGRVESNRAASKPEPFEGITTDELKLKWEAAVAELSVKGIDVTNAEHALEGALSIREFEGTVVRHESFVFLDVVWLTRILKPLLNHKETKRSDGKISLGDTGGTPIILEESRHVECWNRLKEAGILEPELARIMWPSIFQYVLPTLASLGLTFPLESDPAEGLVVLLRLGEERPDTVGNAIDAFLLKHSAVLNVRWECFLGFPPGAIEKVLARCCRIGSVQTFWRFGVLVQGALSGSEGTGSFALVLEYSSDPNQLDLKVYGDICTVAPWAALAYAISTVKVMAMDFPGLTTRAFVGCPEHGQDMVISSMATHPGDKLLGDRGCRRCSPETRGIGAAAVELVRMVDVRKDRGVVFRETNVKFVELQVQYDVLRRAESRDLHADKFISEDFETARETFLNDLKEDLETVLRSAGAAGASGPQGQDGQHQDWKNLQLTVEDIQRRLEGDERDVLRGLETTIGGLNASNAKMAELLAADDGVMERLDFLEAMLMTVRGDKVDTPRHACLLPGNYAEPHGLSDELRRPEVWTRKVEEWRESDFEAGKGVWKKKMRLFLVCAHSHELVPCGHNGRGYDIQSVRKWVRMTVDVAKFALQVTCATVAAVAVAQLPATTLGGVGGQAGEAASAGLSGMLGGLTLRGDNDDAAGVQALEGNAYECLRRFVHDMEDTARVEISAATKKAHKKRRAPPSTSEFVYFDQVMVKVQSRTGDGEALWVLSDFEEAWRETARKAATECG
ncbi:unnamed protein product, partial [Laminaria digitata]